MKSILIIAAKTLDLLLSPLVLLSSMLLFAVKRAGLSRMRISRAIFMKVGVFPIIDHYYEPLFNTDQLSRNLSEDRFLPGIDFNIDAQLGILDKFNFNNELLEFSLEKTEDLCFYYHNGSFESGDAEYLYNMIRLIKPGRFVEIGCGFSTLMAQNAIKRNIAEDAGYSYDHVCIEPFENAWLNKLDVKLIREKVESVPKEIFKDLRANDMLFIDSSHIIRPQGDVLFLFLELLPALNSGVYVHIHDIFTPKDYPPSMIVEGAKLFNEMYIMESLLSMNNSFRVIAALNYLKHNHFNELAAKCPVLSNEHEREPGSFWIQKV